MNEQYDLIYNFDGLTEYGINNTTIYINKFGLLTKKNTFNKSYNK